MAKISLKIEQTQQLSPQQVLQASLLQLTLPLLEQRILQELEVNPAIEMIELSDNIETDESSDEKLEDEEEIDFEWEELLGVNDDYEYPKEWKKNNEEFETPMVSNETFSERIIKQLQDCDLSKKDLQISEQILGNLDEQGYLKIELSLISDRMQIDEDEVLKVMYNIQRLDPPGLASRNLQECLLAQAEFRDENPHAVMILQDYFDDFANHRYEKIIEGIGCTKEELNEAMEFIARMNPSPRDDQLTVNPDIIIPDVAVEERSGEFIVSVQDGNIPEIRVSETYIELLNKHGNEKDVKKFLKKKLESANWFVEAIKQRKNTIQKVMESIIKKQPDYFIEDKRSLKPMILKDIADDINMDISTISRVTNGKYVQLPWEIKELKTFFSEGIETQSGDSVSNSEVKNTLKKIIETEDKSNPVSDEKLTELLNNEGYKIARRTVAKYREQLKYSTARLRRKL